MFRMGTGQSSSRVPLCRCLPNAGSAHKRRKVRRKGPIENPGPHRGEAYRSLPIPVESLPAQDVFHEAPVGQARLEQVQPDEGCKQEPPRTDPVRQHQADEQQGSGDDPDLSFQRHCSAPFISVRMMPAATVQQAFVNHSIPPGQEVGSRRRPRLPRRAGRPGSDVSGPALRSKPAPRQERRWPSHLQ